MFGRSRPTSSSTRGSSPLPETQDRPLHVVRFATVDEAPEIASVLQATFAEFEPYYTPGGFSATSLTTDLVLSRWNDGPVWVAIDSKVIVGTVAAKPVEDSLYVRSMAVIPASQGRGVGRLLMQEVEGHARSNGLRRLYLNTTHFFDAAIRLYEGFGFARIDESSDLFGTPLLVMEKWLTS